jgi:hypothetical protein
VTIGITLKVTSVGLNTGIFDMEGKTVDGLTGGPFSIVLHSIEWVV